MKRAIITVLAVLSVLAIVVVDRSRSDATGIAHAQTALADYAIDWFTIDSGGAMYSSSGEYTLGGTIGQPDAGIHDGSPYTLSGGFWPGAEARYTIAVPIVQR
jgi:hypothetical protein